MYNVRKLLIMTVAAAALASCGADTARRDAAASILADASDSLKPANMIQHS